MVQIDNAVLPKGSLILVTGANGFVASHVIDQLLELGYKVRGAARSQVKLEKYQKRWDSKYPGQFEFVEVPDILKNGAYDEAIKGTDGVAHVASNVSFSPKFDEVVGDAVQGTLNALRAAAKTPSVKRFVLTSSIVAVGSGQNGEGKILGQKDFNRDSIEKARGLPDDAPQKGGLVYAASKTSGELEAWKFVEENKPSFVLNVVNPAFCAGESLVGEAESTAGMLQGLFLSKSDHILSFSPTLSIVPVADIARLHIGGLLLPDVKEQRLIAAPHPVNWVDVLDIYRKLYPNKKFYDNPENAPKAVHSYDSEPALKVLKQLGRDDWVPLEEALKKTVEAVA